MLSARQHKVTQNRVMAGEILWIVLVTLDSNILELHILTLRYHEIIYIGGRNTIVMVESWARITDLEQQMILAKLVEGLYSAWGGFL